MSKKKNIQDILEAHLDKIVLGVIALISLYLLWVFVVGNPYGAQAFGRKFGPGRIDLQNRQQARVLEEMLSQPAAHREYDLQLAAEFEELLQTSLPQLAVHLPIPYPAPGTEVFDDDRVYPTPEIIALSDVQVAAMRGAVFKPTEEVTPEIPYQAAEVELGDLDLVTIAGRIDVSTLYRNFQQSFMGPRLKATWREQDFARPVVARLELQRRQKLDNGLWSEWTALPRTQIDPFRKLIEQTPLTTDEMEFGGVMLWLRQYEDPRVQVNLLQPNAYDFASVQTGWLPPNFLDEAQTILKRQEDELRRQMLEERQRARETTGTTTGPPGRQPTRQPTQTTRPQPRQRPGETVQEQPTGRITLAAARRERTLDDVLRDMQQERINEQTRLENRRDPLLVWAHDDNVQPGESYQYRIRLGVFNPIAGRNWFRDDQQQYKNQLVLWSNYSEPTREVAIPKMMHVFPLDVLDRDAGGGVKVDIARYYLGQWRTHEFEVFPGQIIGHDVEYTQVSDSPAAPARGRGLMPETVTDSFARGMGMTAENVTQNVDFSSPYMLVDVSSSIAWSSDFRNRSDLWNILYYGPEQSMLTMAVGNSNWPSGLNREYRDIKEAERNPVQLNLTRSTSPEMMPRDMGMPGGGSRRRPIVPMPEVR